MNTELSANEVTRTKTEDYHYFYSFPRITVKNFSAAVVLTIFSRNHSQLPASPKLE
jgi:hypothetical protein